VRKTLQENATLISMAVICLETGRLMMFIILFTQSLIINGMEAAKATAYVLCCQSLQRTKRVAKRWSNIPRGDEDERLELDNKESLSPSNGAGCSVRMESTLKPF